MQLTKTRKVKNSKALDVNTKDYWFFELFGQNRSL